MKFTEGWEWPMKTIDSILVLIRIVLGIHIFFKDIYRTEFVSTSFGGDLCYLRPSSLLLFSNLSVELKTFFQSFPSFSLYPPPFFHFDFSPRSLGTPSHINPDRVK